MRASWSCFSAPTAARPFTLSDLARIKNRIISRRRCSDGAGERGTPDPARLQAPFGASVLGFFVPRAPVYSFGPRVVFNRCESVYSFGPRPGARCGGDRRRYSDGADARGNPNPAQLPAPLARVCWGERVTHARLLFRASRVVRIRGHMTVRRVVPGAERWI